MVVEPGGVKWIKRIKWTGGDGEAAECKYVRCWVGWERRGGEEIARCMFGSANTTSG